VEPGGFSVRRILQQVQQGMEGLAKVKEEVLRAKQEVTGGNPGGREWNPGSGENGQDSRPKKEAAQKATDALKKGADATRGRGQRKGRMYQRAGVRNLSRTSSGKNMGRLGYSCSAVGECALLKNAEVESYATLAWSR
jgi:hypothetical protein